MTYAYVGCYTSKSRNGRGTEIGVHRMDEASGAWAPAQIVPDLVNPSMLALDRSGRFLSSPSIRRGPFSTPRTRTPTRSSASAWTGRPARSRRQVT